MKKILMVLAAVLLLSVAFASPVFAADPPGMDVDIVVVTPDDVDLDIGINAGGDVDIVIDGVDYKQVAETAQDAYNKAWSSGFTTGDFWIYWNLSGIGSMVNAQLAELQGLAGVLLNAEAMLIEGHELTKGDIADIRKTLALANEATAETSNRLTEINTITLESLAELQAQVDENEWQLWNGAEYHIGLLEVRATAQEATIIELQNKLDNQANEIASVNEWAEYSLAYTNYLRAQTLWAFGGFTAVLLIAIIWLVAHNRKLKNI